MDDQTAQPGDLLGDAIRALQGYAALDYRQNAGHRLSAADWAVPNRLAASVLARRANIVVVDPGIPWLDTGELRHTLDLERYCQVLGVSGPAFDARERGWNYSTLTGEQIDMLMTQATQRAEARYGSDGMKQHCERYLRAWSFALQEHLEGLSKIDDPELQAQHLHDVVLRLRESLEDNAPMVPTMKYRHPDPAPRQEQLVAQRPPSL